jgi:hypothetical protein
MPLQGISRPGQAPAIFDLRQIFDLSITNDTFFLVRISHYGQIQHFSMGQKERGIFFAGVAIGGVVGMILLDHRVNFHHKLAQVILQILAGTRLVEKLNER